MSLAYSNVGQVVGALIKTGAYRATKYVSERRVIIATRGFKPDKRNRLETFTVTLGVPNWEERKFIKDCKRAGEPLPVRKIQLKFRSKWK